MKMQPALSLGEISRSHRAGEKKPNGTRSILVKFASYSSRDRVIRSRKLLKGHNRDPNCTSPCFVAEDLTKKRANLAYQARQLKKDRLIKDTWSWDGRIFVTTLQGNVSVMTRVKDLDKFRKVPTNLQGGDPGADHTQP